MLYIYLFMLSETLVTIFYNFKHTCAHITHTHINTFIYIYIYLFPLYSTLELMGFYIELHPILLNYTNIWLIHNMMLFYLYTSLTSLVDYYNYNYDINEIIIFIILKIKLI